MSRREKLEKMLETEPGDVFLHYALATEWLKLGDFSEAAARFESIHREFPDYVAAWFRHAQAAAEHGDISQAKQLATTGLSVARRVGDHHAAGELAGFLESLEN